jgi:hypothetical protein
MCTNVLMMRKVNMALLTGVNETTRTAVENLMDTFAGTDGGAKYVRFCTFIIQLDRQAKAGDEASVQLLEIVHRMSRFVDITNRP